MATVLLAAASFFAIRQQLGPAQASGYWDRYIAETKTIGESLEELRKESTNEHLLHTLVKLLDVYPNDARGHLKMAILCLQRFDIHQQNSQNPLPLTAIHDAVVASQFSSTKARDDWLAVAVGQNLRLLDCVKYDATMSLRLSPLQGEAYLALGEIAFLNDHLDPATYKRSLIEQALKVRPFHGAILAAAGTDAARVGDAERAIAFWKQAFHKDKQQQLRLIEQLARHAPPSFFLTQFDPDLEGLQALYNFYQREDHSQGIGEVGPLLARQLEEASNHADQVTAVSLLANAYLIYKRLDQPTQAIACLERAVELDPSDYSRRRTLGYEAYQMKQYEKAVLHLRWCRYRKSDDEWVQSWLEDAYQHTRFGNGSLSARRDSDSTQAK